MSGDELQSYRNEIVRKLDALTSLFAKVCIGDYSSARLEIPDDEDEFTKLYVGVDMMLTVINKQLYELKEINHSLEKRIEDRTTELRNQLDFSKALLNAQSDLGEGVMIFKDPNFQLSYVNVALSQMTGYSAVELIDMPSLFNLFRNEEEKLFLTQIDFCRTERDVPKRFDTRIFRKDGSEVPVEVVIKSIPSNHDGARFIALCRDITERKENEERIRLLDNLMMALNQAEDFESALNVVLHRVCTAAKWTYGEAWIPEPDGATLRLKSAWYEDLPALKSVHEANLKLPIRCNDGMHGRAWAKKEPQWVFEMDAQSSPNWRIATDAGLHSAVAIPILSENTVVAVLVFFMAQSIKANRGLSQLVMALSAQLGLVFQRKRIEAQRDRFFSLSLDMLCIIGFDGHFKHINPACETTLGFSMEELKSKKCWEWVHPEDRGRTMTVAQRLLDGTETLSFENRVLCKDGTYKHLLWSVVNVPQEQLFYAVARDITDLKQAEEQRVKLAQEESARSHAEIQQERAIFLAEASALIFSSLDHDSAPSTMSRLAVLRMADWCAVYLTGPNGDIDRVDVSHANPAKQESMTRLKSEAARINQFENPIRQALITHQVVVRNSLPASELKAVFQDDSFVQSITELGLTSFMAVPIQLRGRPLGVIFFALGESVQTFRPEDLELAEELAFRTGIAVDNARLFSESEKAKEELAKARDAALESARLKSEFVANVSHEIRTPLNGIIGMSNLLNETRLSPQQQDFLETIRSSSEILLSIINDILDFSKVEANKMELEIQDFDLKALLASTIELVSPKAAAKKLGLKLNWPPDVPRRLKSDEGRLRQVVMNLLSNAVKFTERGEVTVRVVKESESADAVGLLLSVIDTGIGIQPDKVGNLFQPFHQVDSSTTRKYGGTGLGLAISKRFVELMGGQIGCESVPGQGSAFWCRLTLEKAPSGATAGHRFGSQKHASNHHVLLRSANRPLHILVAEDNSVNQKVVLLQLQKLGVKADAVGSGAEAIAALKDIPYDLILMDCQMPDMDGYTATAAIRRQNSQRRSIPIIAMTAHALKGDREKCLQSGMNDYIAKPVQTKALAELIKKWVPAAEEKGNGLSSLHREKETLKPFFKKSDFLPFQLPKGIDDLALLEELVEVFLKNTPAYLDRIKIALKNGEGEAVRVAAHTLKGSCLNLGLSRMAALSRRLENANGTCPPGERAEILSSLETEFEKLTRLSKIKK